MTPLLQVKNLTKTFTANRKTLIALKNINLSIVSGQTLGLIGESGCGKTTFGQTILRIQEPTSGTICFQGQDITHLSQKELHPLRKRMQMIFQDPYASLDPRMTVEEIISEPLQIHLQESAQTIRRQVAELIDLVNLPSNCLGRYPHEFSGGQRQRIGIARALALRPELIVCDEPVSALDLSIQAQIINLLMALQKELNITYLLIAHDFSIIKILATHVAVMLLGEIVEWGPVSEVYTHPQHPYTKILFDCCMNRHRIHTIDPIFSKDPPSPLPPKKGCVFCTRCPQACPSCFENKPLLSHKTGSSYVACTQNLDKKTF